VDNSTIVALAVLAVGVLTLVLLGAAEAGVIAGVRERALKEPAESPVEALRRFYQERQLTLSALALARNIATVTVTAVAVYLVLRETDRDWLALALTIIVTASAFMALRGLTRSLVSRDPVWWQQVLRPFVATIRFMFRVPVALIDAPLGAMIHAFPRPSSANGTPAEEVMLFAEMEDASAALEEDEREMIRGVMELEFTPVREVMIPRTDIVSVETGAGFDKLARVMVEKGFSRVPVYEGDIDHILGIAHIKEVLKHLINGKTPTDLREVLRPAYVVPESKKVDDLLQEMKEKQISITIVVDEYGGTAGLVTVEDLVEEIVGEIRDEYDVEEQAVQQVSEDEAIVDGRVSIDELNELFDMEIHKDDFDSVGGFIVNELGRMPSIGDTVRFNGVSLKVLSVAGRRIKKVRVQRVHGETAPGTDTPNGA
jgi:putative hemolysin